MKIVVSFGAKVVVFYGRAKLDLVAKVG